MFKKLKQLEDENAQLKNRIKKIEDKNQQNESLACRRLTILNNNLQKDKDDLIEELRRKDEFIEDLVISMNGLELDAEVSRMPSLKTHNERGAG